MIEFYLYSEKDLVEFGNYMLSEERNKTIENEDNKAFVHDCDIRNFNEIDL